MPAAAQERGGTPGRFDFYVLALSWSPTFCALTGERRGDAQCDPGRNPGFVVHGLWPQYDRGYPSECGAFPRPPSRQALAEAEGVFPTEGLARYEWRKHGTCSGEDPASYFRLARRARDAVTIPERLRGGETLRAAPIEVARLFVTSNPGLRPDMMSVTCRAGRLEEVRICLSKDLRSFTPCPDLARQNCRAGEVTAASGP
ncbi:ribonuclease T2 [Methylobacterium sp. 4-46]|uniref:ribonuclease T2 family protein n=1 Tax=unclassified Methylobacterium TaxID=2615210 RepID=UPI000165C683|nr:MULTISPECIES: ribonuclease T2 [Methylobacterium]ACA15240.1 ribonuclease T2 [Methylobacterium sp. 4-46]WFT80970.1 ribonuclease T2 [Methylobacterium nodulans]